MPFSSSSAATSTQEGSATPLADYFWIAGVDGTEILDTFQRLGDEYRANNATSPGPAIADTIEEDADAEEAHDPRLDSLSRPGSSTENRTSVQRLSFRSGDSDPNANGSSSNRSSMTIKGANNGGNNGGAGGPTSPRNSSFLDEAGNFDFDKALLKFASERESFLSDLSLSAGAITPNSRPRSRLRTQKIVSEDNASGGNLLRSGIGSVRRHMAMRDMNSMKRQPSVARQGENTPRKTREGGCLTVYSIATNLATSKQLQLRHPCSPTARDFPHHASPETAIRACPARPISYQEHVRGIEAAMQVSRLCAHVCLSQRYQHRLF